MSDQQDHDPVDHGETGHDAVGHATGTTARTSGAVVGVVVVAMIALLAIGSGGGNAIRANSLLGERVPAVTGTAVDGTDYDIDDKRGEWVLVNFFGTWCPPCVAEHPELVELERWGAENGRLSLMSIAFNDRPEDVQDFFDQYGGSWPVLDDANLSITFQISLVPESFLIAPSGIVVQHFTGGIEAADVQETISANDFPASQGGVGEG